MSIPFFIC